jgi:hypothetical protein
MTRHAREAISLAVAAALGETALYALTITDWSQVGALALVFAFLNGPPLFLALITWRRRTHPERTRVLFGVAAVVAGGGLFVLGLDLYRFSTDPKFRNTPNMHGLIVPLVQWVIVGAVWLWLVIQEAREKRARAKAAQVAGVGSSTNPTNPPQSA